MSLFPGRYTATIDGDFVVFMIGMRINRPWKPHKWLPVFAATRPMIRELEADPASGFLGATFGLLAHGPAVVQYWQSFEDLERYARRQDARHLPAWRRFNQRVRGSGDVGIWHETYRARRRIRRRLRQHVPRRTRRGRNAHAHRQPQLHRRPTTAPPPQRHTTHRRLLTDGRAAQSSWRRITALTREEVSGRIYTST